MSRGNALRTAALILVPALAACADGPARSARLSTADVICWDRLDLEVRVGMPLEWDLPVHNPVARSIELSAVSLEGCGACLSATWADTERDAGELTSSGGLLLGPRERGVLRVRYSGARLVSERFLLTASADGAPPQGVSVRVRRLDEPLLAERSSAMPVVGRSDVVDFALRGSWPVGPLRARVGGGTGGADVPVRVVVAPPGWRSDGALVRIAPFEGWRAAQSTVVTVASADGADRSVIPLRVTARDPFRVRRRRGGDVDVVIARVPCSVRVTCPGPRTQALARPSAAGVVFRLAARERLLVPGAANRSICVSDVDGEFEVVLRGRS